MSEGPDQELTPELAALIERFRSGQRAALARGISEVENERPGFQAFMNEVLAGHTRARRVGLTGPPGAGKSSLVAALATLCRAMDERVGIVAVDPTSPFSGGAMLGDRIRMNDLATDPGVFIRSMATRGSLGGLATTTNEVIDLMDAFGLARLFVETVGVGQTELEITGAADTVVVVLVPESGDAIQAMKAGLMEIADVFVVNKADRPGADRLVTEIETALHLRAGRAMGSVPAHHGVDLSGGAAQASAGSDVEAGDAGWKIPVLTSVALSGEGVDTLLETLDRHRDFLDQSGELVQRRRQRAARRIRAVVRRELGRLVWARPQAEAMLAEGLDRIERGEATPYSISRGVIEDLIGS
ncbi:MAG: methylmalonyl Co-A mutase-associated GTPase MeaB [Gemmatimonadota bacterium]|nr:MAG: methylmalonyl Co-A mutase-associated GTPase MeaB [Gemmatimonadota bacterium]